MIYMPIALALLGLIYMIVKQKWVMKQDAGDGKMKEISDHIYEGALAFLNAEYRLLSNLCSIVSVYLRCIFCSTNYTLVNSCCFYFWSHLFCLCRKHWNEDRYKNKRKNNTSCSYEFTKCTQDFFWWWYCNGIRCSWFGCFRIDRILYYFY